MTWLCNSKEAIEHKKKCKDSSNCYECQWIDAASGAMEEYGTVVEPVINRHPLYEMIKEKFGGKEID
tara:strand:- start:971 stop:1171 length:201 start_codon:yes stop_codon:yes gene_type:complete